MEKSKAEEMTEVPERPNEDSRAIVELFKAGPDSHFFRECRPHRRDWQQLWNQC